MGDQRNVDGGQHMTRDERNALLLGWMVLPIPKGASVQNASANATNGMLEASEGVSSAGPGRVWFHTVMTTLAMEPPRDWVSFAKISGGILADVSEGMHASLWWAGRLSSSQTIGIGNLSGYR